MVICIDLGATNIKGALMKHGKIVKTIKVPTDHSHGREGIVASLKEALDALYCKGVRGAAIASAGDIDRARGVCTYATGNLEGFTGFDFPAFIEEHYALPCVAINDAFAALLGEMRFGAGRTMLDKRVLMLTLGSGVGGAFWKDGDIFADESNGFARFGHFTLHEGGTPCNCGKIGCVEQYLSGRALNRLAAEHGIPEEEIFKELTQKIPRAVAAAEEFVRELNAALDLIYAVCPFEVCILGGGVAEGMGENFRFFKERCSRNIVPAELGNRAGLLGAYALTEDKSW